MTLQIPARAQCAICGKKVAVMVVCLEKPSNEEFKAMRAKKLQMRGWSRLYKDSGPWICKDPECRKFIKRMSA